MHNRRITTQASLLAAGGALALLVAACSSGGGAGTGAGGGGAGTTGSTSSGSTSSGSTSSGSTSSGAGTMVTTANGTAGTYLTDGSGRTLYLWMADKNGKSTCSGSCAAVWPPLTTKAAPAVGGSAKAADLGTVARSDGTTQVTYNGHPLYYYASDSKPGDMTGEGSNGFGAKWWIVAPSGTAITTSSGSSSSGSGGSSGGGGGGGGYGY